jgi:hypothetical protein
VTVVSRVKSGGGTAYRFSVTGRITCKDASLFDAFSGPGTSSSAVYTRLYMERLTLPMHKCRGFQTPPRDSSRGPVQARYGACTALPPRAPDRILPSPFPRQYPVVHTVQGGGTREWCCRFDLSPVRLLQAFSSAFALGPDLRYRFYGDPCGHQPANDMRKSKTPGPIIGVSRGKSMPFTLDRVAFCVRRTHTRLTPYLKLGGCASGVLNFDG